MKDVVFHNSPSVPSIIKIGTVNTEEAPATSVVAEFPREAEWKAFNEYYENWDINRKEEGVKDNQLALLTACIVLLNKTFDGEFVSSRRWTIEKKREIYNTLSLGASYDWWKLGKVSQAAHYLRGAGRVDVIQTLIGDKINNSFSLLSTRFSYLKRVTHQFQPNHVEDVLRKYVLTDINSALYYSADVKKRPRLVGIKNTATCKHFTPTEEVCRELGWSEDRMNQAKAACGVSLNRKNHTSDPTAVTCLKCKASPPYSASLPENTQPEEDTLVRPVLGDNPDMQILMSRIGEVGAELNALRLQAASKMFAEAAAETTPRRFNEILAEINSKLSV